jgi:hypothetical protein
VPEPGEGAAEQTTAAEATDPGETDAKPTGGAESAAGTETTLEADTADADEDTDENEDEDEDVDLEDATVDVMRELDEGGGANRETLVAAVVDRYGADPGEIEEAIQDALMDGRCYEPDDATLKPI